MKKYWHIFALNKITGESEELGTGRYDSKEDAEGSYKTINDNEDDKYSNPKYKCYSSLDVLKSQCKTASQMKAFNELVKSFGSNKYKILIWNALNSEHKWINGSIDITANSLKEAKEIAKKKYGRYDSSGDFDYKVVEVNDYNAIEEWENKHEDNRGDVFSNRHS